MHLAVCRKTDTEQVNETRCESFRHKCDERENDGDAAASSRKVHERKEVESEV